MADDAIPRPPTHLSAKARRIWTDVHDRYELDAEDVASLTMALDAFDLAHRARNRIERDGHVVEGRGGVLRVHPSFDVLKSAWAAWVAFVRALELPDLDAEPQPRSRRGTFASRRGTLNGR